MTIFSLLVIVINASCSFSISTEFKGSSVTCKLRRFLAIGLLAPWMAVASDRFTIDSNQLIRKVADDITIRQALYTADFSRNIYSTKCRFQDEIDTYDFDQYIKGTKALFNPTKSHVDLIGDVKYDENSNKIKFAFSETLAFNVPFNPKVDLTGKVELHVDSNDGLIDYSREFWDQSVVEVLKTIHL